jgi:single-strand DNA-binding protein
MLKTEFVGHIGADAEIKDFNGKRFISFNVATSERFKDAQGQTVTRTTWVSCLKPGDGAVVNYLKKGTQVFCRGNLTAKPYTGKNGVEAGLNCTVTELELLGSRQDAQQNQQAQPEAATPPQSCPAPGETYPGGYSGGYGSNQYPGGFPTQNEDRLF